MNPLFEPIELGSLKLSNRIIRSATFEGMADSAGFPTEQYQQFYSKLSQQGIGAIITGFVYVHPDGRAMHPGQAGLDSPDKIPAFQKMTNLVHQNDSKILVQLAHTGRQTLSRVIGKPVSGISRKKSPYFNEIPRPMSESELDKVADDFTRSAQFAREAGFDGIQLHAAHGYLLHQSVLPSLNNRKDSYGLDIRWGFGTRLLQSVVDKIRQRIGNDFPVLIKVSHGDDIRSGFSRDTFIRLIGFLDTLKIDGIEISYGTMDWALNIFRGKTLPVEAILKYNPRYRLENPLLRQLWKLFMLPILKLKIKLLTPTYNLEASALAKQHTTRPIISVGGFRSGIEMLMAIESGRADFISLCRPLLAESNFLSKVRQNIKYTSRCLYCNHCAILCDSDFPTRCYYGRLP